MEKNWGPQIESEISVFDIFSRLHHYLFFILHKIAASDSV